MDNSSYYLQFGRNEVKQNHKIIQQLLISDILDKVGLATIVCAWLKAAIELDIGNTEDNFEMIQMIVDGHYCKNQEGEFINGLKDFVEGLED